MTVALDNIESLLADLAALDIHLRAQDGRIGYDAPSGRFTVALKQRVQSLRPDLLARLSEKPVRGAGLPGGNGDGLVPGAPAAVVAPLSSGQERMWFLNRLEGREGLGSYTEHLALDIRGSLDRAALAGALSAIAARHGALRTLFRDGADGPEQVVRNGNVALQTDVEAG